MLWGRLGEYSLSGNVLILALYVIFYIIFVRIYDAFQIRQVRKSELFFSQIIAISLTNAIFFIIVLVLLRQIPDMFIYIVSMLFQMIISLIWCVTVSPLYFKIFKKRKAVVIYDSIHNLHEITKHIMFKRSYELTGAYDIDEVKSSSESERVHWLCERIRDAETVFVMEIPSHEALKGFTKNIFWKPCLTWFVDRVRIMNPIRTHAEGQRFLGYRGEQDRAYFTYLEDVRYQVEAHFEFNPRHPEFSEQWTNNMKY